MSAFAAHRSERAARAPRRHRRGVCGARGDGRALVPGRRMVAAMAHAFSLHDRPVPNRADRARGRAARRNRGARDARQSRRCPRRCTTSCCSTRDSLLEDLGADRADELRSIGGARPVEDIVHRTRKALVARPRLSRPWPAASFASGRRRRGSHARGANEIRGIEPHPTDQVGPAPAHEGQARASRGRGAARRHRRARPGVSDRTPPGRATDRSGGTPWPRRRSRSDRGPTRSATGSSRVASGTVAGPTSSPRPDAETNSSIRSSRRACFRSAFATRLASAPEHCAAVPGDAPSRVRRCARRPRCKAFRSRSRRFGVADELHRRVTPGAIDVVDLVVPLVELADRVHPPVDVAAPVRRAAGGRARRPRSSPSCPPRRSSSAICTPDADAPDHEHSPSRSSCDGRRYSSAVDLFDAPGPLGRERGTRGSLDAPVAATTASHCQ